MKDLVRIAGSLATTLGSVRFIAVAYLKAPPQGVDRFSGTVPSSCTFWQLASSGNGFYTVPGDHLNCSIGNYTSGFDAPPDRAGELEQTLSLMASIGYVRMEEVPSIPRLPEAPAFIYYAPLEKAVVAPDVVIAAGRPAPLMRLQEAAARAGAASQLPLLGRPTCMALPASIAHGSVMSAGCIGNRVYTGLKDDELYVMLPGERLADIASELSVIQKANETLQEYHQNRKTTLTRG
jgi:uncharacterized protein (DUF169 family)